MWVDCRDNHDACGDDHNDCLGSASRSIKDKIMNYKCDTIMANHEL